MIPGMRNLIVVLVLVVGLGISPGGHSIVTAQQKQQPCNAAARARFSMLGDKIQFATETVRYDQIRLDALQHLDRPKEIEDAQQLLAADQLVLNTMRDLAAVLAQ
jgi:hypothetical protein